jgi:hypothetical protein
MKQTRARWVLVPLSLAATAVLSLVVIVLTAPAVSAQPIELDVPTGGSYVAGDYLVNVAIGLVVPVLTGLALKYGASSGARAIVSIVLNGAAAVIVEVAVPGQAFELRDVAYRFGLQIVSHVVAWQMVWQPVKAGGENAPLAGTILDLDAARAARDERLAAA